VSDVSKESRAAFVPNPASMMLDSIRSGKYRDRLAGTDIGLFIDGGRSLDQRPGSGQFVRGGCQILVFGEATNLHAILPLDKLGNEADAVEIIANHRVVRFEEERQRTFLLTIPKPNVLLICTDRVFLEEVLERCSSEKNQTDAVTDFAEFKNIDDRAVVWALRHLGARTKPITPNTYFDRQAVGVVYMYLPFRQSVSILHITSGDRFSEVEIQNFWSLPDPWRLQPKIRVISPGLFEITYTIESLRKDEAFLGLFLLLRLHFGYQAGF
jgi:hypothetical protein